MRRLQTATHDAFTLFDNLPLANDTLRTSIPLSPLHQPHNPNAKPWPSQWPYKPTQPHPPHPSPTPPNPPLDPPWITKFFILWLLGMFWSALWPKSRFYGLPTLYLNAYSLRLMKWWQRPRGARVCRLVSYVSRRRPFDIEDGVELAELPIRPRRVHSWYRQDVRVENYHGKDALGLGWQRRLQVQVEVEQKRLADEEQQRREMEEEAVVAGMEEEKREIERERAETLRVLEGGV